MGIGLHFTPPNLVFYKYLHIEVFQMIKIARFNAICSKRGNYEVSLSLQNIQTFNLTETVEPDGQTYSL